MSVMQKNIRTLAGVTAIVLMAITIRLVQVHVFSAGKYRALAYESYQSLAILPARRGDIVDRHLNPIVTSTASADLYIFPNLANDLDRVSEELSEVLGIPTDILLERFQRFPLFSWVKRKVAANELRGVLSLDYDFLGFRNTYVRTNVEGILEKVIGSVDIDGNGISGIELMYDSLLKGEDGKVYLPRDAMGRPIWSFIPETVNPQDGYRVVLTIDAQIQHIVERHLRNAVEEKEALRGVAVAVDPHTGAVLAMADVEGRGSRDAVLWPVSSVFEPGSIFKAITAYAALAEGIVTPETVFETDWKIRIGSHTITNYYKGNRHVWKKTFREAFAQSDNVIFVTIAQMLGKEKFMDYVSLFGFGMKTGIDFPGEVSGFVPSIQRVGPVELATMSFGQGIAVTAMQMVRAYSALVNGGFLIKPYFVEKVEDQKGNAIYQSEINKKKILDETISNVLKGMLTDVVGHGTGRNARAQNVSVGGKTGTSQKAVNGVYSNKHIASFIGFAPAEQPQIVLLIILDEPRKSPVQTGGYDAAPVFSKIVDDIFTYWNSR